MKLVKVMFDVSGKAVAWSGSVALAGAIVVQNADKLTLKELKAGKEIVEYRENPPVSYRFPSSQRFGMCGVSVSYAPGLWTLDEKKNLIGVTSGDAQAIEAVLNPSSSGLSYHRPVAIVSSPARA